MPNDESCDPFGQLQKFLWEGIAAGAIEAFLSPPKVTSQVSLRPVVSALARLQAQRGRTVSNQLRQSIRLSDVSCFVAGLLDGTRDSNQLEHLLRQAIESGSVVLGPFDHAESDCELVEKVLEVFRRTGFLIA